MNLALSFINSYSQPVLDIIWPLKKEEELLNTESISHPSSDFFEEILIRGLKLANENPSSPPLFERVILLKGHPIIALTVYWLNFITVPYCLSQNFGNQSLFSTVRTAITMQSLIAACFSHLLDKKILKKYHLISEGDCLDQYTLQGVTVLFAKGTDLLTGQKFFRSLHFISALISTFPLLHNVLYRSKSWKKVSQMSHHIFNQIQKILEKPLVSFFKPRVILLYRAGFQICTEPLQAVVDKMSKLSESALNFFPFLPESGLKTVIKTVWQYEVEEPLHQAIVDSTSAIIQKTSSVLAEKSLKVVACFAKVFFDFYICNKALTATLKAHPLLTSVTLIAKGGSSQNIQQLALRVSGACFMILTGSTFWPLLIVESTTWLLYGLSLRQHHLKTQGIEDPLIKIKNNLISGFLTKLSII